MDSKVITTPKDFFLYLASIVTLYVSTWGILSLLFEIINYSFPDRLESYIDPYSTAIRLAIASLIIIFPVYLFLTRYLRQELNQDPGKRELFIRKFLVYLTVFLAGAIIIGDLVALINTFLGGEISSRFMLKVLAMFVVAGTIFSYYGLDLKQKDGVSSTTAKKYAWGSLAFIIISIIGGFLVMGSPFTIRQVKFDQNRINDLQNIQQQVLSYWQTKRVLPDNLEQVNNPIGNYSVPLDPETNLPYDYRVVSDVSFQLCANFGAKSVENSRSEGSEAYAPYGLKGQENWRHPVGKFCFDRTIDPSLYPVNENTKPARPIN